MWYAISMSIPDIFVYIIILLFSVILHEIAHGVMAERFGDSTARDAGRITLNPISHIDPIFTILIPLTLILSGNPPFGAAKPVPVNYYRLHPRRLGIFWVSIAGILTNLLLAFIFSIPLHFSTVNPIAAGFFYEAVVINIYLAVVNMIPIPPIDGSKVLAAILGDWALDLVTRLESNGILGLIPFFIIIYLIFLTPLFTTVTTPVVGFFFKIFGLG
jgi:Zn-dependent protease